MSAADLTNATCDTERSQDLKPSPPLGPIEPCFTLTLVSCAGGKHKTIIEEKKIEEREENTAKETKQGITQKNSSHVFGLPVNNKKKQKHPKDLLLPVMCVCKWLYLREESI